MKKLTNYIVAKSKPWHKTTSFAILRPGLKEMGTNDLEQKLTVLTAIRSDLVDLPVADFKMTI